MPPGGNMALDELAAQARLV